MRATASRSVWLTGLLFFSVGTFAEPTVTHYLSGTDKDHRVDWDFKISGGRNSGQWHRIPVPSNWEMEGFGTYRYWNDWEDPPAPDREGLYRHRFQIPGDWRGKAIDIVFGGVMTDAEVRVNGTLAGPVHQGGFYEFRYPISELLKYDGDNLLEVKVDRFSANQSVNLAERRADFWMFSGIYRPVWLEARPAQHIRRVAIDARHTGELQLEAFLDGIVDADQVRAQVRTLDNQPVGKSFSAAISHGQTQVRLLGNVSDILPWNAETPHRYQLVLTLHRGDAPLHSHTETIGFRTVEVRPRDGFYVNGQKVRLKGVNRHEFWPTSGRTTSREISLLDINLIKSMNMNAMRVGHYPPSRHFLEVADELGLYVINELTGWQDAYDTEVGRKLVKELVVRDVNHPSVIIWANGNEGGWNTELDGDYHRWDIQKRPVIHPWEVFGGIDTSHYETYNCCTGGLFNGRELFMPTEFLHALYDGGGGAGLDDWWRRMLANPLAIGGFIWAFADEGIVRDDLDGMVDAAGNLAPDGVLGPYREKEGSYYAIREIWSPVYFPQSEQRALPPTFDGKLVVENRYDFTNLHRLTFRWQLRNFALPQVAKDEPTRIVQQGLAAAPNVAPGMRGILQLPLPDNWQTSDALALTVTDHTGRELHTWDWMITSPAAMAERALENRENIAAEVTGNEDGQHYYLGAGDLRVAIDKGTGYLAGVTRGERKASLRNGPRLVTGDGKLRSITRHAEGDAQVVRAEYDGELRHIEWRLRPDGWLKLTYAWQMPGRTDTDALGVTFDYPESQVTGARWLGQGPYRVWKNRLKGLNFGVWQKDYNDTMTGVSWEYPEFKGFHSQMYWVQLQTRELPITLVTTAEDMYLRLFTPREAEGEGFEPMSTKVVFPEGDISLLQGIAPIGTKFIEGVDHGPAGAPNRVRRLGQWYQYDVYFYFGELDE